MPQAAHKKGYRFCSTKHVNDCYSRLIFVYLYLLGLEAQLLGIVVRKERPELEEQKDALVINIAANKKKLEELEDEILR